MFSVWMRDSEIILDHMDRMNNPSLALLSLEILSSARPIIVMMPVCLHANDTICVFDLILLVLLLCVPKRRTRLESMAFDFNESHYSLLVIHVASEIQVLQLHLAIVP